MSSVKKLSTFLAYVLRHSPESIELEMDERGWVSVSELIKKINNNSKYSITADELDTLVKEDEKGRYRYNENKTKIKACQGHSIPYVKPEMEYKEPPEYLYHGTTQDAFEKIKRSGFISKMTRHAVHMQEDYTKAWQSATRRRNATPVLLKINAKKMYEEGYVFGCTDNNVWCTDRVPYEYIIDKFYGEKEEDKSCL